MLLYKIAETIGCTVEHIMDNMSKKEFYGWASWFKMKDEHNKR